MKTNIQIYQPADGEARAIPLELANARAAAINNATVNMRLFGIRKITVANKAVGIKTLADVSYSELEGNIPDSLAACRNHMARQIAEYILQFGILDIEMMPTDDEKKIIQTTWDKLKSSQPDGTPDQQGGDGTSTVDEIKLNIDNDPSGKNVLENTNGCGDRESKDS